MCLFWNSGKLTKKHLFLVLLKSQHSMTKRSNLCHFNASDSILRRLHGTITNNIHTAFTRSPPPPRRTADSGRPYRHQQRRKPNDNWASGYINTVFFPSLMRSSSPPLSFFSSFHRAARLKRRGERGAEQRRRKVLSRRMGKKNTASC